MLRAVSQVALDGIGARLLLPLQASTERRFHHQSSRVAQASRVRSQLGAAGAAGSRLTSEAARLGQLFWLSSVLLACVHQCLCGPTLANHGSTPHQHRASGRVARPSAPPARRGSARRRGVRRRGAGRRAVGRGEAIDPGARHPGSLRTARAPAASPTTGPAAAAPRPPPVNRSTRAVLWLSGEFDTNST
jgi:hypothetical protein